MKSKTTGLFLFQASAAMLMRSVLFWDITQRRVLNVYRRFGTTYRSHLCVYFCIISPEDDHFAGCDMYVISKVN
jgi:hypothetical protein